MFWFKKPKKLNETTRLYALYGESANLSFLDSAIKDNNSKIDTNANNIETNRNNIVANANRIEEVNDKVDNIPTVDLTEVNNRINNNTRNIATNVTNINNLNTKVNKITNDLSNANIASYKGTWNSNTTYMVGDIVNIGDKFYLAVVRNTNSQPPTNGNDKWKLLTFTVDTSSFITDSALNPLRNDISTNRNNISTNSNNITTLTNRVDNLTQPPKQALWKYFSNISLNLYKKTISTPNKMFWYELSNTNKIITISDLKRNTRYAGIVYITSVHFNNVLWNIKSLTFTLNQNTSYNIYFSDIENENKGGYLINQDLKPGSEGVFSPVVSLAVILWEIGN